MEEYMSKDEKQKFQAELEAATKAIAEKNAKESVEVLK